MRPDPQARLANLAAFEKLSADIRSGAWCFPRERLGRQYQAYRELSWAWVHRFRFAAGAICASLICVPPARHLAGPQGLVAWAPLAGIVCGLVGIQLVIQSFRARAYLRHIRNRIGRPEAYREGSPLPRGLPSFLDQVRAAGQGLRRFARTDWPSVVLGVGVAAFLHFVAWRWPRIQAWFGHDEEAFDTAAGAVFVLLVWAGSSWSLRRLKRIERDLERLEQEMAREDFGEDPPADSERHGAR